MLRAFALSVLQLGDRALLSVLARSLAVTLALFVAAGALLWWGLAGLVDGGAHEPLLVGSVVVVVSVLGAWLLFRTVAVAVIGLFADAVVDAVERRHYPEALARARPVPLARGLAMAAGSAGRVVAVNLLLAPAYLALLVTGVGTAALFALANAWLLGRDLGDMVAARHLPRPDLAAWRAGTRGRRFLLGLGGTGLFLVPGLNLLAPVLGAAMATHIFHGDRR